MSKFIFSVVLMLVFTSAFSQQEKDTIVNTPIKNQRYGLRIGADLYTAARSIYDDKFQGFEIVGDYRLSHKFFAAAEIGNTKITVDDDQLNFTTNGTYLKVGFDYNTYENWLDMQNMIYVGMRYGVSSFSQTLNSYQIYDPSGYYDPTIIYPNQEYTALSAHWLEFVAGVKAELVNNLFIGFSLRLKALIVNNKPDNFDNLYIPGFNRTYEGSFGTGFNYTISYLIPIYKKGKK